MITYSNTKAGFIYDVIMNSIEEKVEVLYIKETNRRLNYRERLAIRNSMQYMRNLIDIEDIPDDAGIAIEYMILNTSKRIDFLITGFNSKKEKNILIIELKQWEHVEVLKS